MTHETTLAAKVAARNAVNRFANEWYARAAEALKPFIGQKICKVDGTLLKKLKEALLELPNKGFEMSGWYSADRYSLKAYLKACECTNGIANYADTTLYLGDLTDGVLTRLYDAPNFKADYTEEFITQTREEIKKAETMMNQAKSKLGDFGMWDQ